LYLSVTIPLPVVKKRGFLHPSLIIIFQGIPLLQGMEECTIPLRNHHETSGDHAVGWIIKNLEDDKELHPLIYNIMEDAEAHKGEEGARAAGKHLYGILPASDGFLALKENESEPCAVLLYHDEKILFFYLKEENPELSYFLAEHAFLELKSRMSFIYSTFPRWSESIGQDYLSPHLEKLGFQKLTLVKMEASLPSEAVSEYFSNDLLEPLKSQGFTIEGFKQNVYSYDVCRLLIETPPPLAASLFREPSRASLEWAYHFAFFDDRGREIDYPPECSTLIRHEGTIVGALLCDEEGWINQVLVDSAYRRKGIARAMLAKAARALPVLGANTMALTAYRENPPALEWYGRAGFCECQEYPVWGWSSAAVIEKKEA
jgi:GNAT superfamily N-acetyltransferase